MDRLKLSSSVARYATSALFALAAASVLGLAGAQGSATPYPECTKPKPSKADTDAAKASHEAASAFYDRADYDRAIRNWKDAYELDCTAHEELRNIANAYEKKGDKQGAIVALETYLARVKSPPDRSTLEAKVKNLKESLAPTPPPPASSQAPVPPPPTSSSVAPPPTSSATPDTPAPDGKRPYGLTPIIVAAGGAALLVPGLILLPSGSSKINQAEQICPNHNSCNDPTARSTGNSGRTLVGAGTVFLIAGGVGLAGGLVWQLAFNRAEPAKPEPAKTSRVSVVPAVAPGLGGVSVSGSF